MPKPSVAEVDALFDDLDLYLAERETASLEITANDTGDPADHPALDAADRAFDAADRMVTDLRSQLFEIGYDDYAIGVMLGRS